MNLKKFIWIIRINPYISFILKKASVWKARKDCVLKKGLSKKQIWYHLLHLKNFIICRKVMFLSLVEFMLLFMNYPVIPWAVLSCWFRKSGQFFSVMPAIHFYSCLTNFPQDLLPMKKIYERYRKKLPENMTESWSHMEMEIPSQPL